MIRDFDPPWGAHLRLVSGSVEEGHCQVEVLGVLDRASWPSVAEALRSLSNAGVSLAIDLSGVTVFDSEITAGLVRLWRESAGQGASLHFVAPDGGRHSNVVSVPAVHRRIA